MHCETVKNNILVSVQLT